MQLTRQIRESSSKQSVSRRHSPGAPSERDREAAGTEVCAQALASVDEEVPAAQS